jgi:hypothetical protein
VRTSGINVAEAEVTSLAQVTALPSRNEGDELVRQAISTSIQLDLRAISRTMESSKLGHADVCAALERVRKDHVLVGTPIDTQRIVAALVQRRRPLHPAYTVDPQ